MANNNPLGTAKYWFDGSVSSCIDNGVGDLTAQTNNWIGNSNYWHHGYSQGYLQGGEGGVGGSLQNFVMAGYRGKRRGARAFAVIIF